METNYFTRAENSKSDFGPYQVVDLKQVLKNTPTPEVKAAVNTILLAVKEYNKSEKMIYTFAQFKALFCIRTGLFCSYKSKNKNTTGDLIFEWNYVASTFEDTIYQPLRFKGKDEVFEIELHFSSKYGNENDYQYNYINYNDEYIHLEYLLNCIAMLKDTSDIPKLVKRLVEANRNHNISIRSINDTTTKILL